MYLPPHVQVVECIHKYLYIHIVLYYTYSIYILILYIYWHIHIYTYFSTSYYCGILIKYKIHHYNEKKTNLIKVLANKKPGSVFIFKMNVDKLQIHEVMLLIYQTCH